MDVCWEAGKRKCFLGGKIQNCRKSGFKAEIRDLCVYKKGSAELLEVFTSRVNTAEGVKPLSFRGQRFSVLSVEVFMPFICASAAIGESKTF